MYIYPLPARCATKAAARTEVAGRAGRMNRVWKVPPQQPSIVWPTTDSKTGNKTVGQYGSKRVGQ